MIKRHRDLLRVIVADLRHTLSGGSNGQRGDLDRELERLGIAPDGTASPFDALPNPTAADRRARRVAEAQLAAAAAAGAADAQRAATRAEIVERAAYTWINRLLALRVMEARGLIDPVLRSDPAYDGLSEALFILRGTQPQRGSGPDGGWWAVIEDACREQAAALPGVFDLADPSAALRPSVPALLRCVAIAGHPPAGATADEAEAAFADPDAIGWAYQFYQEEAKARTYAKLNSGGKAATRAEIAAVTQLFTEPYMVKWLLQNSLGRTYHELHPDSRLPETWEYYIRDLPRDEGAGNLQSSICNLESLTFMDPCMGSGHFEREAFDMYAAMYREQHPGMGAAEIADRILTHHLHGIDLDPRAAQLAALTLYLRAWEMVRAEQRARRRGDPSVVAPYRPPAMNLATTPTGLTPGSLERHLQRHPEDRIYRPLLEGIFAALEQADVLGSLLRPGEQLDAAIRAFRSQGGGQLGLLAEDNDLNRLLGELARHDPGELKRVLLERVGRSFAAEATDADDVAMALFGREAGEGLRLLKLLDRQYDVVATNPPYMGNKNMDSLLKIYVATHYQAGKGDLYAAFMLRCRDLSEAGGRVAMVTMQSWMFLRTFAHLRASEEAESLQQKTSGSFRGILRDSTIEVLAHLGANAFDEIAGEVVQTVLFVLCNQLPRSQHRIIAYRVIGPQDATEKAKALLPRHQSQLSVIQLSLTRLDGSPVVYQVGEHILDVMISGRKVKDFADVRPGPQTSDNSRFYRSLAEVPSSLLHERWHLLSKGGGYRKWYGYRTLCIEWKHDGARIKEFNQRTGDHWSRNVRNVDFIFLPGYSYSAIGRAFAARVLTGHEICDTKGPGLYPFASQALLALTLNCRLTNYFLKVSNAALDFNPHVVASLPVPDAEPDWSDGILSAIISAKASIVDNDPTEYGFSPDQIGFSQRSLSGAACCQAVLLTLEAFSEVGIVSLLGLPLVEQVNAYSETGMPVGSLPLVANYDAPPRWSIDLDALAQQHADLKRYLGSHPRLRLTLGDVATLRATLKSLYEAGPGMQDLGASDEDPDTKGENKDTETLVGTSIPIPAETFLEELSQQLQIHPISIYWLLEELRAEGVRCKPEELRLLEDRLSVLVLRLLGHRWPRQIEAGEPVPSWADPDGIIPLTAVAGEASLAERVRDRLRAEDGDRGAQQVEALLLELTGQTLDEWLRRTFFARHVRQFKHRPIAWHLASKRTKDGGRRTKVKREPAFECVVYYHACRGDVLARVRAHYVEPLIRLETAAAAEARRRGDETAAAIAVSRVQELEEFAARLREVEESGFACDELDRLLAGEPLDRWSGDGVVPPTNAAELAAQERAWRVDINDGVRVNIAPLQLAGLLPSDVLRPDDARKGIADRARWRSDERRWVREGVLPRCGWMDEDVPESPRWTERAPEREAEQRKLEEKRRAVMAKLGAAPVAEE